jgi:serine phosphatase RsbU (regulator of sigma subunit)
MMNSRVVSTMKIIKIICVLFFAGSYTTAEARDELRDSLFLDLAMYTRQGELSNDTSRINTLLQIASYYQNFDADSALFYQDEAIKVANDFLTDDQPDSQLEKAWIQVKKGTALKDMGWGYFLNGDYDKSRATYDEGMLLVTPYAEQTLDQAVRKKAKFLLAAYIGSTGVIFIAAGDYPKALDYCFQALDLQQELGNRKGEAVNLSNIGITYMSQGNYPKALEYYFKSLAIDNELGNKDGQLRNYGNIGGVYMDMMMQDSALYYLNLAYDLSVELNSLRGQAINLSNIGVVHADLNQPELGLEATFKALELNERIGNKRGQGINLVNIGSNYITLKKYSEAEAYLKKGLVIADEIDALDIKKDLALNFSDLYKNTGRVERALEEYQKFIVYRDSLFNIDSERQSMEKEQQFNLAKDAAEDSVAFAKQKELDAMFIARQDAELKAKNNQQVAMYGGLILLVVFGGFMYNRFKVTSRQKEIIEGQKMEVEHQKHLVEEKQQEVMDSITYAKRIQSAILPPDRLIQEHLAQSFILYKPKDIVAGDFYWLRPAANGVLFAAADCTGHGVPGALVSVVCSNALNRAVNEFAISDPGKILDKVRELVIETFEKSDEEVKDGMDISLCLFSPSTLTLSWAGANNPLWIVRKDADTIDELKADKQPIGKFANAKPFTTHTLNLQTGDTIYVFTDGFQDQFGGEKGKKFKASSMKELLLTIRDKSMADQHVILNKAFEKWRGLLEQVDDVCVIGVRI